MNDDKALTIQPVSNGFIVHGAVSFQHDGPRDQPSTWHVFESFEALTKFLSQWLEAK